MNTFIKITSSVEKNYRMADLEMAKLEKACKKGCDICCHQIAPADTWEELKIIEYIHLRLSLGIKSILKKNLEKWFEYFNKNTRDASRSSPLSPVEFKKIEYHFRQKRVPCPMLVDSVCSIYEVRPMTCRVHIEPTDPDRCKNDPHRITTSAARQIFKASIKGYDPTLHIIQSKPIAYAVAGELGIRVGHKPILGLAVDFRDKSS